MTAGGSGGVRSLAALIERQAEAARDLGRAGRSSWNGRVSRLPRGRAPKDLLGMADWDGTLLYSEYRVLRPLRDMFARTRAQHSARTLARYKEALLTVFHENNHLLAPVGQAHHDGRQVWDWATAALEEGVTELYSRRRLGDFITRLGLEAVAPGVGGSPGAAGYPQYVPAVEAIVGWVAQRAGLPEDEVLRQLNAETPAGKYCRLAELAIGQTERPLVAEGREAARRDIEQALRRILSQARRFPLVPGATSAELSRALGLEATRVLEHKVQDIQRRPNQQLGTQRPRLRSAARPSRPGPLPPHAGADLGR